MKKCIVGTRGSKLAVTQTSWAVNKLRDEHPDLDFQVKTIQTAGDKDQKTGIDQFDGLGIFVKELQTALLNGEIDCAVHSLKDVPDNGPEGLSLVSYPVREDARDIFISQKSSFMNLPPQARIGTGSPRRIMQLRQIRPDLEYVPLRGNLDTRIKKCEVGEIDGIVLAAAGLKRLGRQGDITGYFSFDQMIPAIGQGSLVLECRADDGENIAAAASINDPLTETTVLIERKFMALVGGGCKAPMACHVYPYRDGLRMMAALGEIGTGKISRVEMAASFEDLENMVRIVSQDLLEDCAEKGIPVPRDLPEHALLNSDLENKQ